jgi:hypothetical protein
VTSANVWGVQGGNTRQNLLSYTLDDATTNVSRTDTGTFTTPIFTFGSAHVLTFNAATQYLAAFQFTDNDGTNTITPSTFQVNMSSSGVVDVPQFSLWVDNGTTLQIHAIIWQSADVKPAGQTAYTVTSPLNVTIQCRIFNAQIRVLNSQGNPAAGAQVTVTLANQTTIDAATDVNGMLNLPMIPAGTFSATITYSGLTAAVSGDASSQTVTTAVISPPPSPTPLSTPLPTASPTSAATPSASPAVTPQIPEVTPIAAVLALIAASFLIAVASKKKSAKPDS